MASKMYSSVSKVVRTMNLAPGSASPMPIVVRDNGVGLPAGLDLRDSGSLGLQLVTALTEQLGATLEVTRDGGTEYRIRFVSKEGL